MLELLLIINLLAFIVRKAFKIKPSGVLACGIFGYCGRSNVTKNDLRIAIQKFKILGILNEDRGKDSCGVYINNAIKKGIGTQRLFTTFIQKETFELSTKNRIFLGHNRQASMGSQINLDNQHPFLIDDDMLITHNGTLKEAYNFCQKYKLPYSEISVDTKMLGLALHRNGPSVLENYKGAAALAITYNSKPNHLYLYHGSSLTTKGKPLEEERPLFFMETREGIYYSSLETALDAIREMDSEESIQLEHNVLVEIVDGKFSGNNVTINRGDMNLEFPKEFSGWQRTHGYHDSLRNTNYRKGQPAPTTSRDEYIVERKGKNPEPIIALGRESLPGRLIDEKDKSYMYYFKGKHRIHKVDDHNIIADGPIWVGKKNGYVFENNLDGNADLWYFWKGTLMRNHASYEKWISDMKTKGELELSRMNFAAMLSFYSKHAVYDVDKIGLGVFKWYEEGREKNGAFTPKFAKRSYIMRNGFLNDIISSGRKETCYYETTDRAASEVALYEAGGLVGIKREVKKDEFTTINKNSIEFYNKVYEDEDEAMKTIGKCELYALDTYSAWFLNNSSPFKFKQDNKESRQYSQQLINEAISNGVSIEEIIFDSEGGVEGVTYLIKTYDDIANSLNHDAYVDYSEAELYLDSERPSDAQFDTNLLPQRIDQKVINMLTPQTLGQIKNELKNEDNSRLNEDDITKVIKLVEETFYLLEELKENADDLQDVADSPEAQEISFKLYNMIEAFKKSCSDSVILSELPEFKEFFAKLEKLKNGIV